MSSPSPLSEIDALIEKATRINRKRGERTAAETPEQKAGRKKIEWAYAAFGGGQAPHMEGDEEHLNLTREQRRLLVAEIARCYEAQDLPADAYRIRTYQNQWDDALLVSTLECAREELLEYELNH